MLELGFFCTLIASTLVSRKEYSEVCTSRPIYLYNQDLLKRVLTSLGKSIVMVTGVGYGAVKAMDALADGASDSITGADLSENPSHFETHPSPAEPGPYDPKVDRAQNFSAQSEKIHSILDATLQRLEGTEERLEGMEARLEGMEERLIRMEKGLEGLLAPLERQASHAAGGSAEHHVTRAELNAAMDGLSSRLETDIERRFEVQNRSVQALRTMIARTDELLEQVIENIESR